MRGGTHDTSDSWSRLKEDIVVSKDVNALKKVEAALRQLKSEVENDTTRLQQQRHELIKPTRRLFLPDKWTAIRLSKPQDFYKTVAASDLGMLVSVFDGNTQYNLGRTLTAKRGLSAWAPMDACYFVYKTKEQAIHGLFPKKSACSENCARVLIHVKCHGNGYQSGDMFAFPYLKFQTILTDALDIKVIQKYRCDIPALGHVPGPRPS
mmetsp:Transcript_31675/g.69228  ORF Transcript_31675/g.69228 Transcript_31675/m.69228 type:complete len:208 (+) Transcript_31675:181-804(+)|eukprot:CAMPEP_0118940606 /NCGR_PEP_ID=MMETSP1169-20130426/31845_1 /TAXON_ID=36882 /ORGANISM="Pyramimonas obovata, Strain CCMP722" /LENGTH=207 /DNA_ID=CAMNT_0006885139 /DNA_START=106 /DNA_END=729 /DNA_ORIENTATION=+